MFSETNQPPQGANTLLLALLQGGAVTVEVFLHRRFGIHYLRHYAPLGTALMIVYAFCWPPEEAIPFLVFCGAFLATWLLTQLEVWRRFYRGDNEHSRYGGYPRLLRRHLAHREYRVKQFFEPMLVGCLGYLVCETNRPLGIFWMFAAACLFITNAYKRAWYTRQGIAMHDAVLEQHETADRFRQIGGYRD